MTDQGDQEVGVSDPIENPESQKDEIEEQSTDPRLKWKITLTICSIINFILWLLLIILMISFIRGATVFRKIALKDDRYDIAAQCEPLPMEQRRVCGVQDAGKPIPEGWRIMTVADVQEYYDECSRVTRSNQVVALHDGKFDGSNNSITEKEFWGCENVKYYMLMNTDCRPLS